MRKTLIGISALASLAYAGAAQAQDSDGGWELHGFGDVSVKSDYVTPRGLVVVDDGVTVQVLNGLVAVAPGGNLKFHAGTWVDLNPGYNKAENITGVNEFDFFFGVSGKIAPNLEAGVEYSQFISGQPSVAFQDERNIEFSLKYSDGGPDSNFSVNPYAKLFWAFSSKSSTVVLGKAGGTFDVELGIVPTIKVGRGSLSAPTWITVGPKTYWAAKNNPLARQAENFGVFSTGIKGSIPITKAGAGGASASLYAQLQYYRLINENLKTARFLLTRSTGADKLTFGAGISIGF